MEFFTEIGKNIPELNYTENFDEASYNVRDAQARFLLKKADIAETINALQTTLVDKFGK